jgi:hypothetical protein
MKTSISWDKIPCIPSRINRRFGRNMLPPSCQAGYQHEAGSRKSSADYRICCDATYRWQGERSCYGALQSIISVPAKMSLASVFSTRQCGGNYISKVFIRSIFSSIPNLETWVGAPRNATGQPHTTSSIDTFIHFALQTVRGTYMVTCESVRYGGS